MDQDLQNAIRALGNITGLFNPFSILTMQGVDGRYPFQAIPIRMAHIAYSLLVVMALAECIRILIQTTGESNKINSFAGAILRTVFAAALIYGYQTAVVRAVSIFPAIGAAILGANANDIGVQIDSALATIQLESTSNFKLWTGNIFDLAASAIFASTLSFIALLLMWILSLLQAYLFLFWFLVGPLAIATWAFTPLNHVFQNWLGSILAVGFWSVTCSIMVCICARAHFLDMGFASGASGDIVAACVYSIAAILMMVSSVWISNRVFGAVEFGLRSAYSNSKRANRFIPSRQGGSSSIGSKG